MQKIVKELHEKAALGGIVNDGLPRVIVSHTDSDNCVTEALKQLEALIASEKLALLENMKEEIQSLRPNFYAEDGWYAANSVIDAQMLTLTQEKNK
jgi:hypothetical protein